ncbi:MAG: hydrogenase maturation protein, partial [Cyanobacteria bacterium NC_groundwater_1444_Ag_S-0.65um_54_12]|nr:hydrogenase maturation protein [Cyanobacteria bacterium NC_groundwater_1444_Ag_S-0.65um_54_12]
MRILFLTHSFNGLAQRLFSELVARGHEVSVEFDVNDHLTQEALALYQPDLLLAPFLKRAIPAAVWQSIPCLVVHPGVVGDRGPSSLDWAIMEAERQWGVTVLQANAEMDAGDVWSSVSFAMRSASKSDLYRREVADAATDAVITALERYQQGEEPVPLDYTKPGVRGKLRPHMKQADRAIDWLLDDTMTILRKLQAADSFPGILDTIAGARYYCYDGHVEDSLRGAAGTIIAQRHGAICRATRDGAIWLGHLKSAADHGLKLPAAMVLGDRSGTVPAVETALWMNDTGSRTYRDIYYQESNQVGYLHFDFYNGALSTEQCRRLLEAYRFAASRPTRVIVLMGGKSFWSNGIHLNVIEAAPSPADESWANINAIDDLTLAI